MFDSLKPESCESHATSRSPSLEAAILIGRHFFGCYQRTFPAFKNPTCGYPRLPWAMKTAHRPRDMDAQKPCQVSSRTYCNTLFPFPALGSQAEHTSNWLWVQTVCIFVCFLNERRRTENEVYMQMPESGSRVPGAVAVSVSPHYPLALHLLVRTCTLLIQWSPTNAGHTGERIRLKAIPSERRSSTDWVGDTCSKKFLRTTRDVA